MNFNNHRELEGRHATLSASKYQWARYSTDKFVEIVQNQSAAMLGTKLHEFAAIAIGLKQKMPKTKKTINAYINDCIGMRMNTEVVLKYSDDAFGTADAIRFDPKTKTLYIFDLKTGLIPAKFDQLIIYAAFFCYEYNWRPGEINIELRIYQNDDVEIMTTEDTDIRNDVVNVLEKLSEFTAIAYEIRKEMLA